MQAQQLVRVGVLLVQFRVTVSVHKCSCASCFAPVVVVCTAALLPPCLGFLLGSGASTWGASPW